MRWKRILIIGLAAAAVALSLYAVSLAQAGIRTLQTSETERAAIGGDDEQIGVNIVKRALEEPLRWIASNGGHEAADLIRRISASTPRPKNTWT